MLAIGLAALAACSGRDDGKRPPPAPAAPAAVNLDDEEGGGDGAGAGGGKWRDAGVYLDGEPVGVLWFGELPETLAPVWVEDVRSLDFKPGDKGPRTEKVKLRRYRLRDYLAAVGVPVARIAAVHIYGPRQVVAAVSGEDLRRAGDRLYFGFGRETAGKPLVYFPAEIATNTTFDHISAVAVYLARPAPAVGPDGEVSLAGEPVSGIPYHGDPLRGGVRVYKDDRLVAWIKRRLLAETPAVTTRVEGELRFQLVPYLHSLGVDTAGVTRAHAVHDERRVLGLTPAELEAAYFTAASGAQGQILLGAGKQPVQALQLYTR